MFMKLKQVSFKMMKARGVVYMLKEMTTNPLQYIHDEPKISPMPDILVTEISGHT